MTLDNLTGKCDIFPCSIGEGEDILDDNPLCKYNARECPIYRKIVQKVKENGSLNYSRSFEKKSKQIAS